MSPVCGNVTAEGWWFTAPQHDLILWCQRAQMPQRWGGANIMESTRPSVRDISWFGISSSAPAGGPYVDLRIAGESGCEAALRVKFPSMAPAVPGTALKRGEGTTFKPYSSIHVPLPCLLHHHYLFFGRHLWFLCSCASPFSKWRKKLGPECVTLPPFGLHQTMMSQLLNDDLVSHRGDQDAWLGYVSLDYTQGEIDVRLNQQRMPQWTTSVHPVSASPPGLSAVSWDRVQGKSVTIPFNTHKIACLKFWRFPQNLINLFSCFTECLNNLFKDAGRPKYLNSFKVLGPRSGLSTAVSNPTVRTRKCLNSLSVSAAKVLVWHFSTVKSPSLKQPPFQHRGLKLQVSQEQRAGSPDQGTAAAAGRGGPTGMYFMSLVLSTDPH